MTRGRRASSGSASAPDPADDGAAIVQSLRRIDARFVLPFMPTTAKVIGCSTWEQDLPRAGVRLVDHADPADLVVASADRLADALELSADELLVPSSGSTRPLRDNGLATASFLTFPGGIGPAAIVPVGRSGLARQALAGRTAGRSRARRLRGDLIGRAVQRGLSPRRRRFVVGGRTTALPRIVQHALDAAGLTTAGARWWLDLGGGDDLQRSVFHVSTSDGDDVVVKFSRVPTNTAPFDNDARGLTLVHALGPDIARRAPRLLARLTVDEFPVIVETRVAGRPLGVLLRSRVSTRRKLDAVSRVVEWLFTLAESSLVAPEALAGERARLDREVLRAGNHHLAAADLVDRVAEVPGVLQHNDLGTWNILGHDAEWGVVDWEDAASPGLPLWDLVYFLTDALVAMSRPTSSSAFVEEALALLAGERDRSSLLFRWVTEAARRLSIPGTAIGPTVTLAWLHHGLSHRLRTSTPGVGALAGTASDAPPLGQLAPRWLDDARLGPTWPALR